MLRTVLDTMARQPTAPASLLDALVGAPDPILLPEQAYPHLSFDTVVRSVRVHPYNLPYALRRPNLTPDDVDALLDAARPRTRPAAPILTTAARAVLRNGTTHPEAERAAVLSLAPTLDAYYSDLHAIRWAVPLLRQDPGLLANVLADTRLSPLMRQALTTTSDAHTPGTGLWLLTADTSQVLDWATHDVPNRTDRYTDALRWHPQPSPSLAHAVLQHPSDRCSNNLVVPLLDTQWPHEIRQESARQYVCLTPWDPNHLCRDRPLASLVVEELLASPTQDLRHPLRALLRRHNLPADVMRMFLDTYDPTYMPGAHVYGANVVDAIELTGAVLTHPHADDTIRDRASAQLKKLITWHDTAFDASGTADRVERLLQAFLGLDCGRAPTVEDIGQIPVNVLNNAERLNIASLDPLIGMYLSAHQVTLHDPTTCAVLTDLAPTFAGTLNDLFTLAPTLTATPELAAS